MILMIETLELFCALLLLQFTAKHKPVNFLQLGKMQNERNWMFGAFLGFVFLVLVMFFTSFLADQLDGTKVGLIKLSYLPFVLVKQTWRR